MVDSGVDQTDQDSYKADWSFLSDAYLSIPTYPSSASPFPHSVSTPSPIRGASSPLPLRSTSGGSGAAGAGGIGAVGGGAPYNIALHTPHTTPNGTSLAGGGSGGPGASTAHQQSLDVQRNPHIPQNPPLPYDFSRPFELDPLNPDMDFNFDLDFDLDLDLGSPFAPDDANTIFLPEDRALLDGWLAAVDGDRGGGPGGPGLGGNRSARGTGRVMVGEGRDQAVRPSEQQSDTSQAVRPSEQQSDTSHHNGPPLLPSMDASTSASIYPQAQPSVPQSTLITPTVASQSQRLSDSTSTTIAVSTPSTTKSALQASWNAFASYLPRPSAQPLQQPSDALLPFVPMPFPSISTSASLSPPFTTIATSPQNLSMSRSQQLPLLSPLDHLKIPVNPSTDAVWSGLSAAPSNALTNPNLSETNRQSNPNLPETNRQLNPNPLPNLYQYTPPQPIPTPIPAFSSFPWAGMAPGRTEPQSHSSAFDHPTATSPYLLHRSRHPSSLEPTTEPPTSTSLHDHPPLLSSDPRNGQHTMQTFPYHTFELEPAEFGYYSGGSAGYTGNGNATFAGRLAGVAEEGRGESSAIGQAGGYEVQGQNQDQDQNINGDLGVPIPVGHDSVSDWGGAFGIRIGARAATADSKGWSNAPSNGGASQGIKVETELEGTMEFNPILGREVFENQRPQQRTQPLQPLSQLGHPVHSATPEFAMTGFRRKSAAEVPQNPSRKPRGRASNGAGLSQQSVQSSLTSESASIGDSATTGSLTSTTTSVARSRAAPAPRSLLTAAQKRENHILSEKKRRETLALAFTSLCARVPGLRNPSRGKPKGTAGVAGSSKAAVLRQTVAYVRRVGDEVEELRREETMLRDACARAGIAIVEENFPIPAKIVPGQNVQVGGDDNAWESDPGEGKGGVNSNKPRSSRTEEGFSESESDGEGDGDWGLPRAAKRKKKGGLSRGRSGAGKRPRVSKTQVTSANNRETFGDELIGATSEDG
ncbi:hypothetical protein HDU93_008663 [Gonapodya sp. JEL0774]|nr:hypothetical protein HDU93_008663 [Gonapodya sp. JEL0774]